MSADREQRVQRPLWGVWGKPALAVLGVSLAWLVFYWPVLFGGMSLHGDFQTLGYPFANLVGRELSLGRLALWDPWRAAGYPLRETPRPKYSIRPACFCPC